MPVVQQLWFDSKVNFKLIFMNFDQSLWNQLSFILDYFKVHYHSGGIS